MKKEVFLLENPITKYPNDKHKKYHHVNLDKVDLNSFLGLGWSF
jgi:hypothetical protein